MLTRRLITTAAVLAVTGCTVSDQAAPPLAGPSELGLSLALTATPDVISQDGVSQSQVVVTARNGWSEPAAGVAMRVDLQVGGLTVDVGTLASRVVSTNGEGRAVVIYTAPPAPSAASEADTVVSIVVTPIGTDYANAAPRTVNVRLVRRGVVTPPSGGLSAVFQANPTSALVGESIVLDASLSNAQGRSITSYQWEFGDGSVATGRVVSHEYDEAGVYAVRLTVTDDIGRSAATAQTVSIGVNLPTADFTYSPTDPRVGESVFFNGKMSTAGAGRSIRRYRWDFGDGATGSGVTASRQYSEPRVYTVVLTVEDDLGQTASISETVRVGDLTAVFTVSPTDPAAGATSTFNASGSKVAAGAPTEETSNLVPAGSGIGERPMPGIANREPPAYVERTEGLPIIPLSRAATLGSGRGTSVTRGSNRGGALVGPLAPRSANRHTLAGLERMLARSNDGGGRPRVPSRKRWR